VILAAGPPRSVEEYPFDIAPELERALGVPVDVVVLNGAPADLVHRVLRDGALVYEGDRAARVAFEVQARNEYFDLAPVLTRYRAAVLRSV
jgi:predicted nucleotidyltransferase